jgi:branched-chain amino acid transport system substrate-binding protein
MNIYNKHFVTGAILLSALAMVGCTNRSESAPIWLGHYGSMKGPSASFGDSTDRGIRLAVQEANDRGGILGRRIKVVTWVDQSSTKQIEESFEDVLTHHPRVDVVLGEVSSTLTLKGAPICQKLGVPMITPSSGADKITDVGDYIFRTCFTATDQGRAAALFIFRDLQARRAALLVDSRSEYSLDCAKAFRDLFGELRGKVVAYSEYGNDKEDRGFEAQLTKIKREQPQAIFVPALYGEVPGIVLQARFLGITVPLVGGDGWDANEILTLGGANVEGYYFITHFSPDQNINNTQKFLKSYSLNYRQRPDALAALAYDAARVALKAIEQAGTTEKAKVRDALAEIKDFCGVTGTITMDPQRRTPTSKGAMIVQIRDGKFLLYRVIEAGAIRDPGGLLTTERKARTQHPCHVRVHRSGQGKTEGLRESDIRKAAVLLLSRTA